MGRYNSDINIFKVSNNLGFYKILFNKFIYKYENISNLIDVKYKPRPDLKIKFLTVHKSKGLQADYVFIINNKNDKTGFPSKITNQSLVDLLLGNCDPYPYSEERRLFYVALTRAKKAVFLLTRKYNVSEFVEDLRVLLNYNTHEKVRKCPICGGDLVEKHGPYGAFLGCSNYRINGCRFKQKIFKFSNYNNEYRF